jgi:tetratricopeptide (TPR) repeat protein
MKQLRKGLNNIFRKLTEKDIKHIPQGKMESTNEPKLDQILKDLSQISNLDDKYKRIQLLQRLLDLASPDHPILSGLLHAELGNYVLQNPLENRSENIEQAIEHFKIALQLFTAQEFPKEWGAIQNSLGIAYSDRIIGDRSENIEESFKHYNLAWEVYNYQDFPEEWAMVQNNIATSFMDRISGDRKDNIEKAIEHCQLALQVYTRQAFGERWAAINNKMGNAYSNRIFGNRAENIEKAIDHYHKSILVFTRHALPMNWAMTQMNLGSTFRIRIKEDRAENIEKSIKYYLSSLEVYTRQDSPEEWADVQNGLGNAYSDRIYGDRIDNIEKAIEHFKLALQIHTYEDFPEKWASAQLNLAATLGQGILGDRADNIEQAIEHYQLSLKVYTQRSYPQQWSLIQDNIGSTLINRILGILAENIENAIDHFYQALQVRTFHDYPIDWAMTQNNLATAMTSRLKGDRAENIEKAIDHFNLALKVYNYHDFPEPWAMIQNNMAATFLDRVYGDQAENIEKAIYHCQEALKVRTYETAPFKRASVLTNMAAAYTNRINGTHSENIDIAIRHYKEILKVYTPYSNPAERRKIALLLGNIYFDSKRWQDAIEFYQDAVRSLEILFQASLFQESREKELMAGRDLYKRLGFCLAKLGNLEGKPDYLEMAVVTLEHGRAIDLGESLARDRADLDGVKAQDEQSFQLFKDASERIRKLRLNEIRGEEFSSLDRPILRNLIYDAYRDLEDSINNIRNLSGYQNFLAKPDWSEIANICKKLDKPLIYLMTTSAGSLALIINNKEDDLIIDTVWRDQFKDDDLQRLLIGWFEAYQLLYNDFNLFFKAIDDITRTLWDILIGQIVNDLNEQGFREAIVIPFGPISLLPIHAAYSDKHRVHAIDRIAFTYAPSIHAISYSLSIQQDMIADSLFAVDNPLPITKARPLRYSNEEISAIQTHFKNRRILSNNEATKESVLKFLSDAQVAHFSCHGFADWANPIESCLLMANDERLTINELLQVQLPYARLAVLSACETGIVGAKIPDEVVCLPSAFLRIGFAGVIASQWSVDEKSTAELMKCFYRFWLDKHMSPARALQCAQRQVRDTYNTHAFYWAAFYLTGI